MQGSGAVSQPPPTGTVRPGPAAVNLGDVGDLPRSVIAGTGRDNGCSGTATERSRLRIEIRGAVQGVGFRPHVFLLARELGLGGWVINGTAGVEIEIEGPPARVGEFARRVVGEAPSAAVIQTTMSRKMQPLGERELRILSSSLADTKTAVILPDLATCADCLRELLDPAGRGGIARRGQRRTVRMLAA